MALRVISTKVPLGMNSKVHTIESSGGGDFKAMAAEHDNYFSNASESSMFVDEININSCHVLLWRRGERGGRLN